MQAVGRAGTGAATKIKKLVGSVEDKLSHMHQAAPVKGDIRLIGKAALTMDGEVVYGWI